jgi:uncharacterized protein involved in response to NO
VIFTGGAIVAYALAPFSIVSGALMIAAGAANLVRVVRWRGWMTGREPLVWILHLGYTWLGLGLLLLGASPFSADVPATAGVHALTAGAVGVMTLAVMTRATRGHTGRPLTADGLTTAVYIAINAAAIARVAAPFAGAANSTLLIVSAGLWTLSFAGFAVAYAPMLVRTNR